MFVCLFVESHIFRQNLTISFLRIQPSPSQPSNPTSGQVVVAVPPSTQGTQTTTPKEQNDMDSQSDPSEVSVSDEKDYSQNSERSSENV
jgi:hypothetical protein